MGDLAWLSRDQAKWSQGLGPLCHCITQLSFSKLLSISWPSYVQSFQAFSPQRGFHRCPQLSPMHVCEIHLHDFLELVCELFYLMCLRHSSIRRTVLFHGLYPF